MKIFILFAAVAGLTHAYQETLEYQYRYSGRIQTGIPDIKNQAATALIEADVVLQVSGAKDGSAIVEISNVRVGEYNGDVGCDYRGDIPIELQVADWGSFEEPFLINILGQEDGTVITQVEEVLWKSNLRKAIVSFLKNEVIVSNFDSAIANEYLRDGLSVPVFTVQKEETLFGICSVDYQLQKLPEYFAAYRKHLIDERLIKDVQIRVTKTESIKKATKSKKKYGRKTTTKGKPPKGKGNKPIVKIPKLENELWHLVRSVDFEHCQERVEFQATPLGFNRKLGSGQYEWVRSRSSMSEYILRGKPGQFRVEEVSIEGGVNVAPFGSKSDMLQSSTNQTLKLMSVDTIGTKMYVSSSCISVKTWMQQVETVLPPPVRTERHDWINYNGKDLNLRPLTLITGMHSKTSLTEDIKAKIIEKIDAAVYELTDLDQEVNSPPGTIVGKLHSAGELLNSLHFTDICAILEHYYSKDISQSDILAQSLSVDVAASSPYADGILSILELAKAGKIKDAKMATVFMSITSSLADPHILPNILDYALNLDLDAKPFLASIVYLNTANLLKKFCNSAENNVKIPVEVLGDAGLCDKTLLTDRVIPALTDLIVNGDRPWKRTVGVLTLQSLGSPLSIPILAPIILGISTADNRLRISAIYGLERWKLPPTSRKQAMAILKDVISNFGESAEVRQSALATLVSWGPEVSYWNQLARSTWSDPSKQMVSFITSTLEAFANMRSPFTDRESQIAYHALRYAKKITPSMQYSYNVMTANNVLERFMTKFQNLAWISNSFDPNIPHQFYYFVLTSMGGFEMTNLEFWIATDGLSQSIMRTLYYGEREYSPGISARIAQTFYKKIQEIVLAKPISNFEPPTANLWFKFLGNAVAFFPIDQDTVSSVKLEGDALSLLVLQLTMGLDYVLAKYINPISLTSFLPSEMGMPIVTTISSPMLLSEISLTTLTKPNAIHPIRNLELTAEILTKISTKSEARLSIYTPWQESILSTGVTGLRDVVLPVNVKLNSDYVSKDGTTSLTLKSVLQSSYLNKFKFLHASNEPFTSIESVFPLPLSSAHYVHLMDRKSVEENDVTLTHFAPKLPFMSGVELEVTWQSKIKNPFSIWSLAQTNEAIAATPLLLYAIASPTSRKWLLEVSLKPGTTKVTVETSCASYEKEKEEVQTTGQVTQEGQSSYDYGFEPQSPQSPQKFSSFDGGFGTKQSQSAESAESAEFVDPEVEVTGGQWIDDTQQRAKIFKEKHGGVVKTCSAKVSMEGDTSSAYETTVTWSKAVNRQAKRSVLKTQLAFSKSSSIASHSIPALVCIDVAYASPTFSDFDTVDSLLSLDRNLNINLSADMTIGCTGKSIATVEGSQVLSKEMISEIRQNAHKRCDYDQYDPLSTFNNAALYDRLKFDIKWEQICNYKTYPVTTLFLEFLDAAKLSHCFKEDDEKRELHVTADRSLKSTMWDLEVIRGETLQLKTSYEVEEDLNQVLNSVYQPVLYADDLAYPKCVLGVDNVRTFDGFAYSYTPTECWTVAVQEFFTSEDGFMILVKSGSGESTVPEVRLIDVQRGLVVELARGEVKVNGKVVDPIDGKEVIKDKKDEPIGIVKTSGDFVQFKVLDPDVIITVKNTVEIKLAENFLGLTRGLCGYYDGEPEAEMVGPAGCYYADPNEHAKIWSGPSDSCDLYTLIERRTDVETFQRGCKAMNQLIYEASQNTPWCLTYGHEIRKFSEWTTKSTNDDLFCQNVEPIAQCEEGCSTLKTHPQLVEFRCWYENAENVSIIKMTEVEVPVDCRKLRQEKAEEAYHYV